MRSQSHWVQCICKPGAQGGLPWSQATSVWHSSLRDGPPYTITNRSGAEKDPSGFGRPQALMLSRWTLEDPGWTGAMRSRAVEPVSQYSHSPDSEVKHL